MHGKDHKGIGVITVEQEKPVRVLEKHVYLCPVHIRMHYYDSHVTLGYAVVILGNVFWLA